MIKRHRLLSSFTPVQQLHILTNRLLDAAATDYGVLFQTLKELYELLIEEAALDTDALVNRENNHLQTGKAIGATWAAMCIQDLLRTKKFMDGVYHAVNYLQAKQPGRKTHILYAGTGPFATLILPLTARFGSDTLQFTLLEVNAETFDCLQRTIDAFQLQPYIREMTCIDATRYNIPAAAGIDILLSETMQHALVKEPQVAIFMNLLPQLPATCLVIPEKITLDAVFINPSQKTKQKMGAFTGQTQHVLGTVFELDRDSILRQSGNTDPSWCKFPEVNLKIPETIIGRFPLLQIHTTIEVFESFVLHPDECALTLPLTIADLSSAEGIKEMTCWYVSSAQPGLQCKWE